MVNSNKDLQLRPVQRAILTTILYSDIFSFPLTKDELWKFLISEKKISRSEFGSCLQNSSLLVHKEAFYCLKKRERIITQRKKNLPEVARKMKRAQRIAQILSRIPSVLFIGVSGGLAAGNVSKKDDIDFVVITKRNTLFATRFLLLIILQTMGVRRFRNQKEAADTICLNLLFDETAISWFENKQDIYIAREISQLFPLFERNNMYHKFLVANSWIKKFLPNTLDSKQHQLSHIKDSMLFSKIIINSFTELVFRFIQMRWMKRHQTNEIVTKHVLAFHPNDYRILTLAQLRLKMRQVGLLTKF